MTDLTRAAGQWLKALSAAGVTHLPQVTLPAAVLPATGRKSPGAAGSRESALPASRTTVLSRRPAATDAELPAGNDQVKEIQMRSVATTEAKAESLCALAKVVANCTRCSELASTRTQTVIGVGDPASRIMFLGEAPGADEDRVGEPFVGRAGQLLDRIIEACTLKRQDIYICNILRCRPPGNRNPLPQEAANCREYLDAQIAIVQPEYILCLGTVAAQNLLGETRPVGKLRGQFFSHGKARVLCTYHPSYLLRNPSAKQQVWEDMKLFMQELGVTLT